MERPSPKHREAAIDDDPSVTPVAGRATIWRDLADPSGREIGRVRGISRITMHRRHAILLAVAALAACRRGQVLSYERYARIEHDTPYALRFGRGGGELLFFGSGHIYDPADPQVERIVALWAEFRPGVGFNEGGDPPALTSVAAAVSGFGESGLVRHLGRRDEVPVTSIEPPFARQVEVLRAARFSDEQIKLFFVLRQAPQHRDRAGAPMSDARAVEALAYFTRVTGLTGSPRTPAELVTACARLLPPIRHWADVPLAWFDPVHETTQVYTNEVSRRTSELRDVWAVDLLVDAVLRGERVFAVMGSSHVVVQEPALRARLGRPRRLA
jgi:hypothetical protein